jgi:hypothetical protein
MGFVLFICPITCFRVLVAALVMPEYGKDDKLNISVVICDTDIPLDSCDRPCIWKGRQIEHIRGHL